MLDADQHSIARATILKRPCIPDTNINIK